MSSFFDQKGEVMISTKDRVDPLNVFPVAGSMGRTKKDN